jgi:hypothetical protein
MIIKSGDNKLITRISVTKNTTDWLNTYISADFAIIRSYMILMSYT